MPRFLQIDALAAHLPAVFLLLYLLIDRSLSGDPGVGWHLATGRLILSAEFPFFDPFLVGMEHRAWVANQWLSDCIFALLLNMGGWRSLDYLVLGVGMSSLCLTFLRLSSAKVSLLGMVIFFPLLVFLGSNQWIVRPVVFSFLLFSLTFVVIDRYERGMLRFGGTAAALFAIFILWANLHPGFMLGFVPLIGLLLQRVTERSGRHLLQAVWLLAISAVATCGTPFGFELHRWAVGLVSDPYFMQLNREWRPAEFREFPYILLPLALVVLLITPDAFRKRPLYEQFACCVLLLAALSARRYITFFTLCAAPAVLIAVEVWLRRFSGATRATRLLAPQSLQPSKAVISAAVTACCMLVCAVLGYQQGIVPRSGGMYEYFPSQAVSFLKDRLEGEKLFHTPDWGGYLTWRFFPQRVATIDDRNELNGKERYEAYLSIARAKPGWRKALADGSYTMILTAPDTTLAGALEGVEDWIEEYRDDRAVVFSRRVAGKEDIS